MEHNAKEIPLSKGLVAWVSAEDYERVAAYKWHANMQRSKTGKVAYYARGWLPSSVGGLSTASKHHQADFRHVLLHRFILKADSGARVDHKNLNRLDCTRSNLRIATNSMNVANQVARNPTGYKGVRAYPKGGFYALITMGNNKIKWIGIYETAEEAARRYDDCARSRYGEFARLNFPVEGELSARL